MTIEIQQLDRDVIGRRLGQNLYNPVGNLLLRKGVEITSRYYDFFEESGYKSIFLLNPSETAEKGPFGSDRLLATAPHVLKKIFRKLCHEDRDLAAQAKQDIVSLAESILVHVTNSAMASPQIWELKRQNDYLYQHCVNVAVYSIHVGQKLGFDDKRLLNLVIAALIHDLGMEFIDDNILYKSEQLDDQEIAQIHEHTTKGFTHLVRHCAFDGITTVASVQHHERFDGEGYPKGLQGNSIHEFSRIIALTDFFDAWTSDRPHRRMHSFDYALDFIRENRERMFDPVIVKPFIELFEH